MEREQVHPQVGRRFEVREQMREEVIRVRIATVAGVAVAILLVRLADAVVRGRSAALAVIEDDDFVDAENGEGAGDLPGEGGF